ncbi:TPA: AAA family ATPase [Vibrio cholerae]|uniref:AAA family ATPase n=1 Tax=Vibrio cholerae TaxID=666 RepID=UPI0010FDC74E|nr:AAA family ATPase [Vibrio cholerae]EGR3965739.1 ATPase [Vibrio cholerae]TLE25449.1 ATPase [Vibrio cholerae]TLE30150.1 ATPase [Vibrio cholerae]TLE35194.1 ATPase [Vibrio cholerae]TLE46417.1 ATPase [Vibrio cholerae]
MSVVIISGGPGAGKTTLLDALAERGYTAYPEIPRLLIEQESSKANGILPWHDLPAFAALCYDAMRVQKQLAQSQSTVFLDRAIPDICAYLLGAEQVVPAEYWQASLEYHPQVFMCEPNSTTYQQDEVRPYTLEEAVHIHHGLVKTYSGLGYQCIDVPMASIEQRVAFVLTALSVAG